MGETFILISRWRRSEQYKSDFNRNFLSQMVADTSFILLNNELKRIFASKVRIFSCSSDGQKSYCRKNIFSTKSFYRSAIRMKCWERQWIVFMSNAKYGDMLHPHASKQSVHLQNYILSHTNQCVIIWLGVISSNMDNSALGNNNNYLPLLSNIIAGRKPVLLVIFPVICYFP